jgi:hypothetical protein
LTEVEEEKLFKKFKKVVDTRDSQKIDKALYNHLHLRTGFIAHYSIFGFREAYAESRFLYFVDHFEQCFYVCYGEYGKFNERLKRYVLDSATAIREEFALKAEQKELMLLRTLAEKHGMSVVQGADEAPSASPQTFDFSLSQSGGQYAFVI